MRANSRHPKEVARSKISKERNPEFVHSPEGSEGSRCIYDTLHTFIICTSLGEKSVQEHRKETTVEALTSLARLKCVAKNIGKSL